MPPLFQIWGAMSTLTDATAEAPTRRVTVRLPHYAESHRNPRNGVIHCVAIPMIMVSLVGLMYAAHPWLAYAFLLASMVYYVRLGSWVFIASMAVISVLTVALVQSLGSYVLPASVAVFVVAWI